MQRFTKAVSIKRIIRQLKKVESNNQTLSRQIRSNNQKLEKYQQIIDKHTKDKYTIL